MHILWPEGQDYGSFFHAHTPDAEALAAFY
jgi:hypothetical protein